jgi:GNAT superfamily N-acetyltransferase
VVEIRSLNAVEAQNHLDGLTGILLDCVAGGASIGFLQDLTKPRAEAFFEKVLTAVQLGERFLFGAFLDSALAGTVQLIPAVMDNQPHRADIAKLLVHRSARGQGIANALMQHVEDVAFLSGKTLLVLDTCQGGDAERLYLRRGWTKAGVIPQYALFPDGTYCDTVIFCKQRRRE